MTRSHERFSWGPVLVGNHYFIFYPQIIFTSLSQILDTPKIIMCTLCIETKIICRYWRPCIHFSSYYNSRGQGFSRMNFPHGEIDWLHVTFGYILKAFFEPRITYLSHTKKPKQQLVSWEKDFQKSYGETQQRKLLTWQQMALQIYRNKESNASLNYLSIKLVQCTMYGFYPFSPHKCTF